ncbi:MAG: hypothetical protein K5872_02990 [Rhizobiaceae bacterium]|nr:hypothetical protein [Rhizobiaceae bacterium]MCV0405176.1 hypothetical protein [Rhizobiaceae bacterium]
MTALRLGVICLLLAAFAWGFAELVEHADDITPPPRPDSLRQNPALQ